tara:strand:+ start:188 stop:424 length:237 start_codon:yes stop_codon:yes gene_type:complete
MGYFYQDWKDKKMFVEKEDGQFVMNFGEAEKSMIQNLEDAIVNITEGASDEKRMGVNYLEYLVDCLNKGKVEVKWNIS